jgi:hypothetical protein
VAVWWLLRSNRTFSQSSVTSVQTLLNASVAMSSFPLRAKLDNSHQAGMEQLSQQHSGCAKARINRLLKGRNTPVLGCLLSRMRGQLVFIPGRRGNQFIEPTAEHCLISVHLIPFAGRDSGCGADRRWSSSSSGRAEDICACGQFLSVERRAGSPRAKTPEERSRETIAPNQRSNIELARLATPHATLRVDSQMSAFQNVSAWRAIEWRIPVVGSAYPGRSAEAPRPASSSAPNRRTKFIRRL